MNVYAFLRNPIYGTAWFDDITLRMGQPDATSTFQNLPVQVLQTAPEQGTKKTLKTKDGLELGLGDSVVTSLKIDGTEPGQQRLLRLPGAGRGRGGEHRRVRVLSRLRVRTRRL